MTPLIPDPRCDCGWPDDHRICCASLDASPVVLGPCPYCDLSDDQCRAAHNSGEINCCPDCTHLWVRL